MMKKLAIAASVMALIGASLASSAWAQTPAPAAPTATPAAGAPAGGPGMGHPHHGGPREKLDKDGDKMISREEAKGHPMLEKNFDAIDTNKDGQLSPDELKAARQKNHPAPVAAPAAK